MNDDYLLYSFLGFSLASVAYCWWLWFRSAVKFPPSLASVIFTALVASYAFSEDPAPHQLFAHKVDHVGTGLAREPMIVEQADGTLLVSGYGADLETPAQTVPRLWKSTDHGESWNAVNVGNEADGAVGNSDVDLAIARDGTIYFTSMIFDVKKIEGVQISVGASQDSGKTWHWTAVSKKRFADRPWVAVAPDGTAHLIWNDDTGVYHSSSHDRGLTWSASQQIHPAGGSSHLAVGPKGEIAVRITPAAASGTKYDEGVDIIAISSDEGRTWQKLQLPGRRDWSPMDVGGATPRWVEPVAWDASGGLYLLWTEINRVLLAQSKDRGLHWKTWKISESDSITYYPYLTVRETGELGATWVSGAAENLRWQACRIRLSEQREPDLDCSSLLTADVWNATAAYGHATVRDSAGEYFAALLLRDGSLVAVTPIQNPETKSFGFSFWTFHGHP